MGERAGVGIGAGGELAADFVESLADGVAAVREAEIVANWAELALPQRVVL